MRKPIEIQEFTQDSKDYSIVKTNGRGIPTEIRLTADTQHRGLVFKGGTTLYLYEGISVSRGTLAFDTEIEVWLTIFLFQGNREVSWREDGTIQKGVIKKTKKVEEPYNFTIGLWTVYFHEGGGIFQCKTSNEYQFKHNDEPFATKPDELISFHEPIEKSPNQYHVSLSSCVLPTRANMGGVYAQEGEEIAFYASEENSTGPLLLCTLALDLIQEGNIARQGSVIVFHETGSIKRYTMARDAVLSGISLNASTVVTLYESGNIKTIFSPHEVTIAGRTYPKHASIKINMLGEVVSPTRNFLAILDQ